MPVKPCLTCGKLSPNSRCDEHSNGTSWNGTRNRAQQQQFRNAVLERAGYRCQYKGCHVTNVSDLQAHHTQPGQWDPRTGLALCRTHHRAVDPHAR